MSVEVNDKKREEMARFVRRLLSLGWTQRQLAVYMNVSTSTISQWKLAKSMGTNTQRAELGLLDAPDVMKPRILELVASLEKTAAQEAIMAHDSKVAGADYVAKDRERRARNYRARAAALRALFT